ARLARQQCPNRGRVRDPGNRSLSARLYRHVGAVGVGQYKDNGLVVSGASPISLAVCREAATASGPRDVVHTAFLLRVCFALGRDRSFSHWLADRKPAGVV